VAERKLRYSERRELNESVRRKQSQTPTLTAKTTVTRMLVMSETLPLSSVKAHFSELVDRVEDQHDRVVVTRNGKPAAVLISADDLESLEETLQIMSDPTLMAQIQESEQLLASGESPATLDDVRAGLQGRRNAAA
jgi:antitoxin YefM